MSETAHACISISASNLRVNAADDILGRRTSYYTLVQDYTARLSARNDSVEELLRAELPNLIRVAIQSQKRLLDNPHESINLEIFMMSEVLCALF